MRTHLHDTRLTIEGEQDSVDQAVKIVEEYNHLTRHGRTLSSAEVKSLMRVATEEPHESPRGMFEHGADALVREEAGDAEKRQPAALHGGDREARHDVRHRPGRHGQDVSSRWPWR